MDNSEFQRNGDYSPTRMDAEIDAVTSIIRSKLNSHPESTVGLMTGAGKRPECLVTLERDVGKLLKFAVEAKASGTLDIVDSLKIAQLMLKNRRDKNQRPRVILFVGSPLPPKTDKLLRLGKELKKNGIAVDLVVYGEEPDQSVLQQFHANVNKNDNSTFLYVPSGALDTEVMKSPILLAPSTGGSGQVGGPSAGSGSGNDFPGGVDPSVDPELAMALQLSLKDEEERQARVKREQEGGSGSSADVQPMQTDSSNTHQAFMGGNPEEMDEDAALQLALQMSLAESQQQQQQQGDDTQTHDADMPDADQEEEDTDENAALLSDVLQSLPDVDMTDERIQALLKNAKKKEDDQKKKEDEEKK